jgi:mRNA interferase MazF
MGLSYHPKIGTLLICDYDTGFAPPEMVKRRPVVVISPQITKRVGLCTVIPLSTTPPENIMPYHCQIKINPPLPKPWDAQEPWVKADMVFAAAFSRLNLIQEPRRRGDERNYIIYALPDDELKKIRKCLLFSLGLGSLTKHL